MNTNNSEAIIFKEVPYEYRNADWTQVQRAEEEGYALQDIQGNYLTPFRYDLHQRIHETHKRQDGAMRHSSWRVYEEEFAVVATIGDYRDISTQYEGAFRTLEKVLDEHWSDDEELFTHFFWPHNGEQLALKMVDGYLGMPTKLALWYYFDSPFPTVFDDLWESQNRYSTMAFSKFAAELMRPGSMVNNQEWTEYVEDNIDDIVGDYPTIPTITDSWLEDQISEYTQDKTRKEIRYALTDWELSDIKNYLLDVPRLYYDDCDKPFADQRWEEYFQHIMNDGFYWENDYTQEWGVGERYGDNTIFKLGLWAARYGLIDILALDSELGKLSNLKQLQQTMRDCEDIELWKQAFLLACTTLQIEQIDEWTDSNNPDTTEWRNAAAKRIWKKHIIPNWDVYNTAENKNRYPDGKYFKTKQAGLAAFLKFERRYSVTDLMNDWQEIAWYAGFIDRIIEGLRS